MATYAFLRNLLKFQLEQNRTQNQSTTLSLACVFLCIGLCLGTLLLPPFANPALAQQEASLTHTYTFGQSIEITVNLPAGNWSPEATLFLRTAERETEPYTIAIENGTAYHQRDLRENPILPFAKVTYWVEYKDTQGTLYRTKETTFLYEDNRFEWQTLHEDNLTIRWVDGSTELMIEALDIARTSLEEITTLLQSPSIDVVDIYIYPSLPDLQMALRLAGKEWIGGKAHPEVGVILLAIPNSEKATLQMQQYIPHELTHLILYQKLGAQNYANLPTWFNEGLASYFEKRPEAAYAVALQNAQKAGDLLSLSELSSPFYNMATDQVILAYAESQSVVSYLQQQYGWSGVRALIDKYADGLEYSRGVQQALGIDMNTLERDWRLSLEQENSAEQQTSPAWTMGRIALREIAPWLLLFLLIFLPGTLSLINTRMPHSLSS